MKLLHKYDPIQCQMYQKHEYDTVAGYPLQSYRPEYDRQLILNNIRDDIKAVRKTTEATLEETKAIRKTTDTTLEEIKGLREDIQPGYGMSFRQMQADIKAIKEQIGML